MPEKSCCGFLAFGSKFEPILSCFGLYWNSQIGTRAPPIRFVFIGKQGGKTVLSRRCSFATQDNHIYLE